MRQDYETWLGTCIGPTGAETKPMRIMDRAYYLTYIMRNNPTENEKKWMDTVLRHVFRDQPWLSYDVLHSRLQTRLWEHWTTFKGDGTALLI